MKGFVIMINIYCDESCHLENDNQKAMVIGGISCPDYARQTVYNDIKKIKLKHQISPFIEIKWNKVSMSKIDFYKELVNYFFDNELLNFRAVVIPEKSILNHKKYNQSHDDFYYKMYFYLLRKLLVRKDEINVYLDIKDTRSGYKIKKLKEIINAHAEKNDLKRLENIQHVRSHENSIIQLTDFMIGAVSYKCRKLNANLAKKQIIDIIEELSGQKIDITSKYSENKFDIFSIKLGE
nr:MAG TPA: Protein of unknown function (DUF3800) [Caudoviricetes sp.]